ncbi:hypothetical protein SAMD00019534_046610 [Acytostelium subglobosum LB1]|uniref:hypothetical protein n=1 Tax=Acytostelium subglobosum LB1 TaxID=1410327 RepID=UPI000644967A|nr:hypothetical protein SAMD00019534_046610 [Acytostelium subglobosum LB1]GAM21486.1 hypothetical protein SAMD00019534_046610 [Acytostelium subglobosum LB1]|eukprot:XP_012755605.1 hypothetical protein SAMD00019534_046610 [Acytostelium subglobosum LB1]
MQPNRLRASTVSTKLHTRSKTQPDSNDITNNNNVNNNNINNNNNNNKLHLENYYKVLKKNVLDFRFEFIVSLKKNEKVRTLLVNLKDRFIELIKMSKKNIHKKRSSKKYYIEDIIKVVKDRNDSRLITFSVNKAGTSPKKERHKDKIKDKTKDIKKREKQERKERERKEKEDKDKIKGKGIRKSKDKDKDKEKEKDKEKDNEKDNEKEKEFNATFINSERRECFFELIWLSRSNVGSDNITIPEKEERTPYDAVSLFVGTWNVGDAPPPTPTSTSAGVDGGLSKWIPNNGQYDIYAIGVQECEYEVTSSTPVECETHWFTTLANHIGTGYIRLESISLVKMRLIIFVKKEHYNKICHVEKETVATGIGGIYGNKGATAISFQFFETSFCFINSHFAAHQEKTDQRNQNYRDIVKNVELGNKDIDVLNQFHHVFWMGDLNYRVDLFREEVLLLISKGNTTKLLANDQLAKQKQLEKVFIGFKEAPIPFLPTYRMSRGQMAVYTEEKQRVPSWCDRVLHKSLPYSQPITCVQYNSAPEIQTSDHTPVYGVYHAFIQRPCLPVPQSLIQPLKIYLTDLRAENLELNDEDVAPSAFLAINTSAFVEQAFETTPQSKRTNPVWGDMPPIVPGIHKRSYLENQHLFVTIYDEDDSNKRLGHATIPLGCGFGDEPYSFKTRITKYGLIAGLLYGKIYICYDSPSTPPLGGAAAISSTGDIIDYPITSTSTTTTTTTTTTPTPSITTTNSNNNTVAGEGDVDSNNNNNNDDDDAPTRSALRRSRSFRKSV